MNVPIALTLGRFVLIPVYILIFYLNHPLAALFVVVLAGVTDVLDGYLARKYNQVTALGTMLDPLADKLMMITVIVSLLVTKLISWQAAAVFFIRDISLIAGSAFFHFRGKRTVPANWMGKLTTVLVYAAFALIFFRAPYAELFLWLAIAFSILTTLSYMMMFKAMNRSDQTSRNM
ncbi:CDP-diacylglycerol--glycerol-3-phosphate 3-phosphatidyltransferase [Paenibacillus sp. y28]|uniref:CDP-diacylglycerol--glycerol-3-phosphate 3-phosphatidyltransferase n=1 Tax=Paenibacillus sp. y28 TaxID=3129110 RepID=UPI0030171201